MADHAWIAATRQCSVGGLNKFPFESIDPEVQVIIIQGPRNSVTTGNSLRKFPKLEVIRITDSNVPVIGAESLWGLQHLKILDFSKNNISLIMQKDFRGQNNLLELDLSKNKIINIASSTFCNLTELRRLSLADNSIGELVQRIFFMLSKLKYLDLSGNPLQDLPPDVFRDVPQLKIFKCRNCQLKKINPQLYNLLPQLTELDLGRNEFKFLDKDEFRDVKHLTKVLLDGNQLSVAVDELFRMQKSLKHLDLSYNRLAKVPNNSFLSLTNLTFLDLSYNKLVRLEPQSVRRLNNLRTLNISGNIHMDLHEIRETFELLPHLTHLSIADMGVLPVGLLVPFKNLRYLNISGNHLDSMSLQVIEPCQELEFLDLSRNQLYGINAEIVLRIQAIRNVRLDNNPLICDECHMGRLIDVIRQLQWKWDTYPICFLPKTLRGAEITDLDANGLDSCLEYITDEEQNAASTSHNFLERGCEHIAKSDGTSTFQLQRTRSDDLNSFKYSSMDSNIFQRISENIFERTKRTATQANGKNESSSENKNINLKKIKYKHHSMLCLKDSNICEPLKDMLCGGKSTEMYLYSKSSNPDKGESSQNVTIEEDWNNDISLITSHSEGSYWRHSSLKTQAVSAEVLSCSFKEGDDYQVTNNARQRLYFNGPLKKFKGQTSLNKSAGLSLEELFLDLGDLNTLAILGGIILVLIVTIIISLALCFSKRRARYYTREDNLNSSEDKCLEKNLEAKATIVAQGNGKINTCMTLSKSNKTHASTLSGNGLETLAEEPLNVVTTPTTTTNGGTNEINFKFPIDDRVCTIDDLIIVPPAPPPPVKSVSLTQQGSEFTNIRNSSNSNSISNSNNLGLMYSTTPRNCGNTTARAAVAAAATLIPPGAPSDIGTPNSLTTTPLTPARSPLPPEAIVMVLPSPTALIEQQQQQQQQQQQHKQQQQQNHPTQQHQRQPQQHLLHLTTLEPLVSVN
uniref:LRRCT domain-containing protein n=1 Tax=Glossina palpalis gambiensis TaxID=67801 RepID=A0A1B0APZ5_9MUSC